MAPDTSVDTSLDAWFEFGFLGAVLFCALVNATAIWALLRHVARRRATRTALA